VFLYFYKFLETIKKISYYVLGLLLIIMTLLVFFNAISRYLFSSSLILIDAFSRYCLIYIAFIGSAIGLYEGAHIGLDYFLNLLPQNIINIIKKFHFILILFAGITMYYSTTNLISRGYSTYIDALMPFIVNRGQVYSIFPISAFLYVLFALGLILYKKKVKDK
jgi:TRAP-type C4-dicarboxylate transport system permease small subunit